MRRDQSTALHSQEETPYQDISTPLPNKKPKPNRAIQDFISSIHHHRVWLHLGVLEVKQRYRRSFLGPWWISMNMLIFIAAMGLIFSRILSQNVAEYIPFFTTGYLLWSFISSCISESTDLFKANIGLIKQVKLPYNLYVLKFFTRNILFLAHNFVVYVLVMVFFQKNPGWNCLYAIPGMLLLILNLYWICLLVAIISTRFRDMVPIITNILQIFFFITPISWMPKLLGQDSLIVKINPFVYFLESIRQPLLGHSPPLNLWIINGSMAIVGLYMSFRLFNAVRSRIAFWID